MTNGTYKTSIGWYIILSHIALIIYIFVLDASNGIDPPERASALSATIPSAGSYLTASILFFMTHEKSRKSKWSQEGVSGHTVAVSFLLPLCLFGAAIMTLRSSGRGDINTVKFSEYMLYIQTAQAVVCGLIYGNLFRKELQSIEKEKK